MEPHLFLSLSPLPSFDVLYNKPGSCFFSVPINFSFPKTAFIETGAFSSATPLNMFQKFQRLCPYAIKQNNPQQCTVKVAGGTSVPTFAKFEARLS